MIKEPARPGRTGWRHGYRFWILRFRRWAMAIDPRIVDRLGYLGLLLLSLYMFVYGLAGYGIVNGNESLYVEAAREMALSGAWAVPTLDGLPYLEKPPLFVWLIAVANLFGGSVELPPRLVTACAALLLAAGIVRSSVSLNIGKRGFAAAFILVTSLGMDIMSRVAMPDMTLTALFALGCIAFLRALEGGGIRHARLAAALVGAASLVKGGLAIALFALIVLAFYVAEPERRSAVRALLRDPVAVLLLFLPLGLWLVAAERALPGAAWHVVVNEHFQRFLGIREPHDYYGGSPLYYVPRLFLFFFPWAGVLLFGWLGRSRDATPQRRRMRRFLWLCVWIPFGFFTLSSAKANYYIILCLPAMALLAADYLPDLLRERSRFHLAMAVILPIMLFIVIWAIRIWQIRSGQTAAVVPLRDGSGPLTLAVLVALAVFVLLLIEAGWRRPALLCVGGLIMPLSLQFDHLVAKAEPYMSARTMAAYIQDNFRDARVFLFEDFEAFGALPIYLKRTIPVVDSKSNDLYYGRRVSPRHPSLATAAEVLATGKETVIVVMNDRLDDFAGTPLAAHAAEATTIGRARLFRIVR